jgi:ABC-type nitrate/sulfonate/bicarbonate transport system substrate-binding protein
LRRSDHDRRARRLHPAPWLQGCEYREPRLAARKSIGISDQANPAKNFSAIFLAKNGIDPVQNVEWRQYPGNLLPLAIDKGEVQALAEIDPLPYLAQGRQV